MYLLWARLGPSYRSTPATGPPQLQDHPSYRTTLGVGPPQLQDHSSCRESTAIRLSCCMTTLVTEPLLERILGFKAMGFSFSGFLVQSTEL